MRSHLDIAENVIKQIHYLTLATVTEDGRPWNSPVFSAFDNDLNFYWSSSPRSQHSKNIDANGQVFIVIYKSVAEQGSGWGVYISASAKAASSNETDKALKLLGARRGKSFSNFASFSGSGTQKIYRAEPKMIWVNDAKKDAFGEYVQDYREEIELQSLRERFRD